jgi:hypothetical protein
MERKDRLFEMMIVAELIEQELVALRHSLDLRKRTIDHCRNCSNPPQGVVDELAFTGNEILQRLGHLNRLLIGREATFARPYPGIHCEPDFSADRSGAT